MKLRTRLVPYASRTSVDGEAADAWHDAMAAHALLQAMDEAQEEWDQYGEPAPDTIKQRAAEILAGWLGEEVAK